MVLINSDINIFTFAVRMSADPEGDVPAAVANAVGGKTAHEIINAARLSLPGCMFQAENYLSGPPSRCNTITIASSRPWSAG